MSEDGGVITFFYLALLIAAGVGALVMAAVQQRRRPQRWIPLALAALFLFLVVAYLGGFSL